MRLTYYLALTTHLLLTSWRPPPCTRPAIMLPDHHPLTGGGPRDAPGCEELPHAKLGRLSL